MSELRVGHQGAYRGCWGCQGVLGSYISNMKMGYCKVLLKTQDNLLQTIEHEAEVNWTEVGTILGHQIALLGGGHI